METYSAHWQLYTGTGGVAAEVFDRCMSWLMFYFCRLRILRSLCSRWSGLSYFTWPDVLGCNLSLFVLKFHGVHIAFA